MATNIQSTALDFNNIKTSLKEFLKKKTEFADFDFDGAGLSNILDVLAHNTHFNGLIANLATNESFIHTAQLRSSLVSHAESLGYDIRSKTSSQVTLDATINLTGVSGRPQTLTLPIGTNFVGTNEDGNQNFITREIYTASDDGAGLYTFKDANGTAGIVAFEGTLITKTFFVGQKTDRQVYIILTVIYYIFLLSRQACVPPRQFVGTWGAMCIILHATLLNLSPQPDSST